MRRRQTGPTPVALAAIPDWVICTGGLPDGHQWQPRPMPDGYEWNQAWWDRDELYREHSRVAAQWVRQHAPGVDIVDLQREARRRIHDEWAHLQ